FNFAASDKIDLKFKVTAIDAAIATGALSTASFDTDLAAAVDAAHLGKHHAVLYTPDSGDLAGKTFLVIDANGVKGYQAGSDFVIQLDQPSHTTSIDVTDFV
ncbi:MAG TPA: bluetail domain-containing putative surface protein, partial [Rhizomicrobium sp.]